MDYMYRMGLAMEIPAKQVYFIGSREI